MSWNSLRLSQLSLAGKVLVTLFVLIIGPGYLFGTANIMFQHEDADREPGLSIDDLRATFHGMTKEFTPDATIEVSSLMLTEVSPDGYMREYLEEGGEPAINGLIAWLEGGSKKEDFDKPDLGGEGSLSAKSVITAQCIECHNADGGDMEDIPFAESADAEADFDKVYVVAEPDITTIEAETQVLELGPTNAKRLVHITHAHILTIPVFTLLVAGLFLMTGLPDKIKLLLAPLPMLMVAVDIGGWWLARVFEPAIYAIAGSGALFGGVFALQILCILGSMWLGRSGPAAD